MYDIQHRYGEKPKLRKTYTELEEAQYNDKRQIYVGKLGLIVMVVSIFLLSVANIASACPIEVEKILAWDGAGDTWSCSNCGSSNYVWEMSCNNCGNSQ